MTTEQMNHDDILSASVDSYEPIHDPIDGINKLSAENDSNSSQKLNLDSNTIMVTIRCEIGTVNLSLNDLYHLEVGDTVDFIRWPGCVRLSANNVIFAEGVLVDVNGMLGVKITKSLQKANQEV